MLYLMVAVVLVRTFGSGKGVLRYAERLAGHDLALRLQSALRLDTYRRLAGTTLLGRRASRAADTELAPLRGDLAEVHLAILVLTHDPRLVARCDRAVALDQAGSTDTRSAHTSSGSSSLPVSLITRRRMP